MMSKPVYEVMDNEGRMLIPRELCSAAGMYDGDILTLRLRGGRVSARKAEIVEMGDQLLEAVEVYACAAIRTMPDTVRLSPTLDLSGLA